MEAQRIPIKINPKENILRHIIIKLSQVKGKKRISKAVRGKRHVAYKGTFMKLLSDFSAEDLQATTEWEDTFKVLKENTTSNPEYYA